MLRNCIKFFFVLSSRYLSDIPFWAGGRERKEFRCILNTRKPNLSLESNEKIYIGRRYLWVGLRQ